MPPDPTVLSFDTSAAHCAAALLRGDTIIEHRAEEMARGQAERLFPLLEEMLRAQALTWPDLSGIGVGVGPGNFTGIRLSVAAARGLALSLGVPAIGVSGLEAQALGLPGPVLSCLDARRDQLFVQWFAPGAETRPALCTLSPDSLPIRPAAQSPLCVGHRAEEVAALIGGQAVAPQMPLAEAIAHLAARQLHSAAPRPKPLYIKAPDAAAPRNSAPAILP